MAPPDAMPPLPARSVPAAMARAAELWPDRRFLLSDERGDGCTNAQFAAHTGRVAGGLLALGVRSGEVVAVIAPNRNATVVAVHALLRAGAVPGLVSTHLRGQALIDGLAATLGDVRVAIVPDAWRSRLPSSIVALDLDDLPELDAPGLLPGDAATPTDVAMVLPTSGTSGQPKGVRLAHAAGLAYAAAGVTMRRLGPGDRVYGFTPLFHADGQLANILAAALVGAAVAVTGPPLPRRFWATCRDRQLTTFSYAGGLIGALFAEPPQRSDRDHPVRVAYGAPSPPDKARPFEERFGVHLAEAYGSTEVGIPVFAPWEDSRVEHGSCGRVRPGYEVRIAPEGELLVRPPHPSWMMLGYVDDPDGTLGRLPGDGWFHTGDLVEDIGDGHLAFRGRRGDAIRRRGEFVPPVVIEQAAEAHPDIVEAAAYATTPDGPSEAGENHVGLAVLARPGATLSADDVRRHVARLVVAAFVPDAVYLVDCFERSPGTGKVRKSTLPGAAR